MKRICALLLALGLLVSLSGCSLFDKSNYELSAYTAQTEDVIEADMGYISDYSSLKRAITWLVSEHQESAELQFQNYDGNISRDISQACWEVKSSTPLGAFAIDYTSCDLSRIVSFYQADLYITYRRSAEQMQALEELTGLSDLSRRLSEALQNAQTYLVLELSAAALTGDLVRELVAEAYYADALACPRMPEVDVNLYPESGMDRIVEISLDYGLEAEELSRMRSELSQRCAEALGYTGSSGEASGEAGSDSLRQADRLYAACLYLAENCSYSPSAGSTAYDALVNGTANAEGMAMACQAFCSLLGIECRVVSGRLDNEPHFWNMVTVDGMNCHVDMTDPNEVFLSSDEKVLGRYWWDTEAYPACPTDYDYFGLLAAQEALENAWAAAAG